MSFNFGAIDKALPETFGANSEQSKASTGGVTANKSLFSFAPSTTTASSTSTSGSLFGSPITDPSPFGAPSTTTPGSVFGQSFTTTSSSFDTPSTATPGSIFGGNASPFGAPSTTTPGSIFGQNTTAASQFNNSSQTPATPSQFGKSSNAPFASLKPDPFEKPQTSEQRIILFGQSLGGPSAIASTFGTSIRHKLIVGIDYGTTFSGVSYVTTDKTRLEDINIITSWPGEQGTSSKTPTRIAYGRENSSPSNKWGFQVHPKLCSYSWTKLLLDKNATASDHDDPSLSRMAKEGVLQLPSFRDASGVCEDFLREVYTYVSEKLRQEMTTTTFENTPMECWITLPAIWSDEAKDATLSAAKKAGFGSRIGDEVFTITEPEAAAIATLKSFANPGALNPLKRGENILICDCGGGTVDITTYVITQVWPSLTFDELQIGAGGKCGSTYVDRNLHSLLSKWFGTSFDDLPPSQKGPGSRFMLSFETFKKSFGLGDDRENLEIGPIRLDIPDSDRYDEDERLVILKYADMQALFDPVVAEITSLLSEQVKVAKAKTNTTIDRVILVGGFAESAYLYKALEDWCWKNGDIKLTRPAHPQAAVVRGAALRGLYGTAPCKRYARRHYGIPMGMLFRENVDPENRSFISELNGKKHCSGRMNWLISKGEEIVHGTERTTRICRQYYPGQEQNFDQKLCSCSLATAPEYDDDAGVESVGVIKNKLLADLDLGSSVTKVNPKTIREAHQLSYKTRVVFGSKGSNLTFKTVVNGVELPKADIVFYQN